MGRDLQAESTCVVDEHYALIGGVIAGGRAADVEVRDGVIVAVGSVDPSAERVDVKGSWIAPAFIDRHVHLAYLPQAEQMAAGGVGAAVDLASPIGFLGAGLPLELLWAGPMITAVGGYPTQSWGRNGYGLEVSTAAEAEAGVDDLHQRGAGVVKIPITAPPVLDDALVTSTVGRAHGLGLKVATHALSDAEAARAAQLGADVLAHTPTASLSEATVDAWSQRAVISTLAAFGGRADTVSNLAKLRASGAVVLYGTDFGNTRTPGIDAAEIDLLLAAGLDAPAVVAAGTSTPASFWGLTRVGRVEVGASASLLVLPRDPMVDATALVSPTRVFIQGVAYADGAPCQ